MPQESSRPGSTLALVLATIAFSISFALWGMIAPMAGTFQKTFHLTEQQTWLLIAVPVLLGSILRLPMGMLADRSGGRMVFGALLLFIALPAVALSMATCYEHLLIGGLVLGMAGTSFSVGVAFVSKWFPPSKQGLALGIYGAGNIGQSIALFAVPVLALQMGWPRTYLVFAAGALAWGLVFLALARNAPVESHPRPLGQMLRVLVEQPLAWALSLFYFVTFGGFVALSIGLPKMLSAIFAHTPEDAGLRVAGFVVVATLMRPVGGWLSDRIGGARLLVWVFSAAAVLALGMATTHIIPFTVGALGVGAVIGLGNGAVFKLVPQYFPHDTGTVTGLVGAMGGLGGFFPPLILGVIKAQTGSYALGFYLLTAFCLACLAVDLRYFVGRPPSRTETHAGPTPEVAMS